LFDLLAYRRAFTILLDDQPGPYGLGIAWGEALEPNAGVEIMLATLDTAINKRGSRLPYHQTDSTASSKTSVCAARARLADFVFFARGCDHGMASRGECHTQVTDSGRLGWTDGSGPAVINHAHHPDELLRGDPDPPGEAEGRVAARPSQA
jgi:hypothetical protein